MTRRNKLTGIFIALIIILGVCSVFMLPASAANVTIGSSLFTNTKNMTVTGTSEGIALKVDQKEFSYTEYATTLPMNNFAVDFKIIDDNFDTLVLTFISMYDEKETNKYEELISNLNRTEADIRAIIAPEKIKNIITVTKSSSGKLNFKLKDTSYTTDLNFKNAEFKVSYKKTSNKKGVLIFKSGSYEKSIEIDEIINDEANLKIEFGDIKTVRKAKDYDKDTPVLNYSTLLIKEISYDYNIKEKDGSTKNYIQKFTSSSTPDTSMPIAKADKKLLSEDILSKTDNQAEVPVYTQYKIPVYGLDIIKSLSSLSFDAVVKYYEKDTAEGVDVKVDSLGFQVEKTGGYYLIEKISLRDGTHTVNFEEYKEDNKDKENTFYNIDGISLPIKVVGVDRSSDPFEFQISDQYAGLFNVLLKGGTNNKIIFPMPKVTTGHITDGTAVRSKVGSHAENGYYITYQIYYQLGTDNPDTWTKYSKTGLEFIANQEGEYKFLIEATDRQGNSMRSATTKGPDGKFKIDDSKVIKITFADFDKPEITVSNFPDEIEVDEKFTVPSASTTDDFDSSPTKTIEVYKLNSDGTRGALIELDSSNAFTPDTKDVSYVAVYNAKDKWGHQAIEAERIFTVIKTDPAKSSPFKFTTVSIIFLVIGGLAAIGIVVLLFIKPKEKEE